MNACRWKIVGINEHRNYMGESLIHFFATAKSLNKSIYIHMHTGVGEDVAYCNGNEDLDNHSYHWNKLQTIQPSELQYPPVLGQSI